jgi:hypothetical protein
MLTFEQFIKEKWDDGMYPKNLAAVVEVLRLPPFNFKFDQKEVESILERGRLQGVLATRKEKCDNAYYSPISLNVTIDVFNSGMFDLIVHYPGIINFLENLARHGYLNSVLFSNSSHSVAGEADFEMNPLVKTSFEIFNYYQSLQGGKEEKIARTLVFAQKVFPEAYWRDRYDVIVNQFKLKYLPDSEITDDDYALNAAHNL